jgi:hypothetical protein
LVFDSRVEIRALTIFLARSPRPTPQFENRLSGSQEETIIAPADKKLHYPLRLTPVGFKIEGQAAVGRLHFASRSASLKLKIETHSLQKLGFGD